MPRLRSIRPPLVSLIAAFALSSCAGDSPGPQASASDPGRGWDAIQREARGQRVDWWMYGGDARVNAYVDEIVIPAARRRGVTLRRVPIADTADAVQRVVAQRRAGRTAGGAVDLIWINGENFSSGKKARLWLRDWADDLPNARYLAAEDPSIREDFQVPVDGQESPWSRAAFVFAADARQVPDPPADLDGLLRWAADNPGRFTYPAPPDFTGSAFVRQVVAAKGEDAAFAFLRELKPFMHREGRVLPKSEAELNELFANSEVDVAMSYDSSFVVSGVRKGQFPESTRPFLLDPGALTNVSFVTIPADAGDAAGAQVVANLLLDPELQARKADPQVLGHPTVLDLDRLPEPARAALRDSIRESPWVLRDLGTPVPELPAERVDELEQRWKRDVLRG